MASRAAILAALLPEDADRDRFLHMLGIHGDPVAASRTGEAMKRRNESVNELAVYGYPRAWKYTPSGLEIAWLRENRRRVVGEKDGIVLDPTAGGGSIPFEAVRLGVPTLANDLNPVAALLLRATVEWPLRQGAALLEEFDRLSRAFVRRAEPRFEGIFPREPEGVQILAYLWARTVACPYCEGLVPLSPNWRLAPDGTGVKLLPRTAGEPGAPGRRCDFAIVRSAGEQSPGTVKGGDATCPFPDCGRVIGGETIKAEAQAGRMGEQLFAVVYKERVTAATKTGRSRERWERGYRAPRPEDDVSARVAERLAEKLPEWEALDYIPTEEYPPMFCDRSRVYGVHYWRDLFSPRQLLGHGTSVEVFNELLEEERRKGPLSEATKAAFGYLAIALDKLCDYNSRMTRWHVNREVMVNTFDRHDFSFKWSYAEMAPLIVGLGYDWAIEQVRKCVGELVALVRPEKGGSLGLERREPPPVAVTCTSADALDPIEDGSIDLVVIDPPYYDNVMYAELSDFFYVWLKRTAGRVFPELFRTTLTDKEQEAVANPARFKGETGAKDRAYRDYRERMQRIFAECRRVLRPDGVMVLMFTHKATGAWDALATGLIEAGFSVSASWPVETEAEGSMHQKDKAAASSTILLVCRPRAAAEEERWWEELEPEVAQRVRERVAAFQKAGLRGVDLYLACFGPALEVFSRHWPVRRGRPAPQPVQRRRRRQAELFEEAFDPYRATPEDALLVARREVKAWRLRQLLRTRRVEGLDPLAEWLVLAWDAFAAPRFPFDEALQLARVVGVELEGEVVGRIAEKKGDEILLWDSATRAAKHALGPADGTRSWLDAVHHAAHRTRTSSAEAAAQMLRDAGVLLDPAFLATLQALLEVLPVGRTFTGIEPTSAVAGHAADFDALEKLRRVALADAVPQPQQLRLFREEAA